MSFENKYYKAPHRAVNTRGLFELGEQKKKLGHKIDRHHPEY